MILMNRIIPNAKVFPPDPYLANLTKQFISTPTAELNEFLIDPGTGNPISAPENADRV